MSTSATQLDTGKLTPIGIEGLDEVLRGGLVPHGLYLVEGDPGAGKTTLALQFMLAGIKRGERCMYVTLSEEEEELRAAAQSHGWSLDGIHIHEILASEESLKPDARYTMYHPSEVELAETTKAVLAEAARIKPDRMVLDSLSEFRMLAENPLRYRRQILALKRYFARQQTTLLLLDDKTGEVRDMQLHSSAQGVISLGAHDSGIRLDTAATADHQDARPRVSARAAMISSSATADCRCFPDWSPPSIRARPSGGRSKAASLTSTRCWAAGSRGARARS